MTLLDEIFEGEPAAKDKFLTWFISRQNGTIEFIKMPYYLGLSALVEWLDNKGLYIDRDTAYRCFRIWDYRESEPETDFTVEWHPDGEKDQDKIDTVKQALLLYLSKGQPVPKPINDLEDDLPF